MDATDLKSMIHNSYLRYIQIPVHLFNTAVTSNGSSAFIVLVEVDNRARERKPQRLAGGLCINGGSATLRKKKDRLS